MTTPKESALLIVAPDERVGVLARRVREAQTRRVDLLVADGATPLQTTDGWIQLTRSIMDDGVSLLLFSADPLVLRAARRTGIETVTIEGATVVAPPRTPPTPNDTALLDALESLPSARPGDVPVAPVDDTRSSGYDNVLADLDDLAASVGGERGSGPRNAVDVTQPIERYDGFDEVEPQRRRGWALLLPLLLIVLVLLGGGGWAFMQRATVTISAPENPVDTTPVENIAIGLSDTAPTADASAVQARQLAFDAEASGEGRATLRTRAPIATARGTLTVINRSPQPIGIPAGTDVLVTNGQGEQVSFTTDQDVLVPGQTTQQTSPVESVTRAGIGTIPITARASGSGSNVPDGGAASIAGFGALEARAEAIVGGEEQDTVIVGEEDVNGALGGVLATLYQRGIDGLQQQAADFILERGTISPSPDQLSNNERTVLPEVVPAVGSTVPDPNNPVFSILVRARFTALATPGNRPLEQQIADAVRNYLRTSGAQGANQDFQITTWTWDGQELRASGELVLLRGPDGLPSGPNGQANGFVTQLQRDLVGKSTDEARALLDGYKEQGLIGDYTLPDRPSLPNWSFLLNIEVAPPTVAEASQ